MSDSGATGVQMAGAAENTRSEPGQLGEIIGFLSRHGSPEPVVPSHCAGDATARCGARPGSSSGCNGNAGLASLTPSGGPGAHVDGEWSLTTPDPYRSALIATVGLLRQTPSMISEGAEPRRTTPIPGAPALPTVAVRPPSRWRWMHASPPRTPARPRPRARAARPASLSLFPATRTTVTHTLSRTARGPSKRARRPMTGFHPSPRTARSLRVQPDRTTSRALRGQFPPSPNGETPLINSGLSLLSLADETRGVEGQDEGTRTPEVGGGGFATYEGAAAACALPPGVVSPPAVTVFGGGLGAAIGPGNAGDANVAHPVEVSESESDLETPLQAPTPTAPAAPMDDDVRQGAGGALQ